MSALLLALLVAGGVLGKVGQQQAVKAGQEKPGLFQGALDMTVKAAKESALKAREAAEQKAQEEAKIKPLGKPYTGPMPAHSARRPSGQEEFLATPHAQRSLWQMVRDAATDISEGLGLRKPEHAPQTAAGPDTAQPANAPGPPGSEAAGPNKAGDARQATTVEDAPTEPIIANPIVTEPITEPDTESVEPNTEPAKPVTPTDDPEGTAPMSLSIPSEVLPAAYLRGLAVFPPNGDFTALDEAHRYRSLAEMTFSRWMTERIVTVDDATNKAMYAAFNRAWDAAEAQAQRADEERARANLAEQERDEQRQAVQDATAETARATAAAQQEAPQVQRVQAQATQTQPADTSSASRTPTFVSFEELQLAQQQAYGRLQEQLATATPEQAQQAQQEFRDHWNSHAMDTALYNHAHKLVALKDPAERARIHAEFVANFYNATPDVNAFLAEWGVAAPQPKPQRQGTSPAEAPQNYLMAVEAFAAANMTLMSIPALIQAIDYTAEAVHMTAQIGRTIAARMDEEAMLDRTIVDSIYGAAQVGQQAAGQMHSAALAADAAYQRWVVLVSQGTRVPSQAVLNATASS
ncbi:hypothetical protein [Nonomuraea sp. NPDC023979]|uniref:hypothetical protein n=1 Tax=Nonomuraea sp. NPDC023979 TaxID=3154796 RepID=UPI0033EA5EDD